MSSVMKISSLLGVKNLFVILVGCLVLSKLFTEVMENMQSTLDFVPLMLNTNGWWAKRS